MSDASAIVDSLLEGWEGWKLDEQIDMLGRLAALAAHNAEEFEREMVAEREFKLQAEVRLRELSWKRESQSP